MFELFGLFLLGAVILLALVIVVGALKLLFKLLLLPFAVAGALFKGLLALLLLPLILLVAVPVLVTVGAVVVPLILLGFALAFVVIAGLVVSGLVSVVS